MISSRVGLLAAIFIGLSGCDANHYSIHNVIPIATSTSDAGTTSATRTTLVTIDAKQRAIISHNGKICTEPPPDVFSVLAQSAGANAAVSKSADPTSLGISGSFSYSSAEQAATISRTQAYNLLALQVYYNCLSALDGMATKLDGPIDRARLQRLIVSTEAIEQLTGVLRPPTVIIGTSASGSSGGSAATVAILDDAFKKANAAATALTAANAAKAKLDSAAPKCADLAAMTPVPTTDPNKTKLADCVAADQAIAEATATKDAADKHYQALLKANAGGAASTTDAKAIEAQVVAAAARDQQTVAQVTQAVTAITLANINDQDEVKFFCIRLLGDESVQNAARSNSPLRGQQLVDKCTSFLMASVVAEQSKLFHISGAAAQAVFDEAQRQTEADIANAAITGFALYWHDVQGSDGVAVPAKMTAKIEAVIKALKPAAPILAILKTMEVTQNPAEALAYFRKLPPFVQSALTQPIAP